MTDVLRMRVFAGPNGSGKSTIKAILAPHLLGHYLNADELEAALRRNPFFHLHSLIVPSLMKGLSALFLQNIRWPQE